MGIGVPIEALLDGGDIVCLLVLIPLFGAMVCGFQAREQWRSLPQRAPYMGFIERCWARIIVAVLIALTLVCSAAAIAYIWFVVVPTMAHQMQR